MYLMLWVFSRIAVSETVSKQEKARLGSSWVAKRLVAAQQLPNQLKRGSL